MSEKMSMPIDLLMYLYNWAKKCIENNNPYIRCADSVNERRRKEAYEMALKAVKVFEPFTTTQIEMEVTENE